MKLKKWTKLVECLLLAAILALALAGCMRSASPSPDAVPEENARAAQPTKPEIPQKLEVENGIPQLLVYQVDESLFNQMDIESYVQGVLAGEMRNDWPMEALKAQAILARTFVLKFVNEKESKYSGADISTDIAEAQAYNEEKINERIIKAVEETRGLVMSYGGDLPYAWFHAHAGGQTDLASVGLEYENDPGYIQSVASPDSERAPSSVKHWTARFTAKEVGQAAAAAGVRTGTVESIELGEKGQSGRAITLTINGQAVSTPALRLQLGADKLKSTLIESVTLEGGQVTFEGSGYGHGVGMSQWGAYGLAEQGADAEEIIRHYFRNVSIVSLWD